MYLQLLNNITYHAVSVEWFMVLVPRMVGEFQVQLGSGSLT